MTYTFDIHIYGADVDIKPHADGAVTLTIRLRVLDNETGSMMPISTSQRVPEWDKRTQEEKDRIVLCRCLGIVTHEVAEKLLRGGEHVQEPHPKGQDPYTGGY